MRASVSPRVRRNARVMLALERAGEAVQTTVLHSASKDLVMALVECAKNVISGTVRLTNSQIAALRRQKNIITELVKVRTPLHRKKAILQSGGFLPLIIRPLISLLGGLLGGLGRK